MEPDDRIQIGVVGKPHGVRGAFHLEGSIDCKALDAGVSLRIAGVDYRPAGRRGTEARPIVELVGVDDRDAIAALRGEPVTARRADLTPLAESEWYAVDLIGLTVRDREGKSLGTIARLLNLPSVDVVEVKPDAGDPLIIPLVADAIVAIDPSDAVIVDSTFLNLG